jgi:hypothetical protein
MRIKMAFATALKITDPMAETQDGMVMAVARLLDNKAGRAKVREGAEAEAEEETSLTPIKTASATIMSRQVSNHPVHSSEH